MHILIPILDLKAYNATTRTRKMKWCKLSQNQNKHSRASTNKTLLLASYCSQTINDTHFVLLYDINSCSNLRLPYWIYDLFSLEDMNDDKCKAEFRFLREDIYSLHDMNIPGLFTCYYGVKVTRLEGLCILLKRYSYPSRCLDLIPRFG